MIVDSSAIPGILFNDPEAGRIAAAVIGAAERHITTLNWIETMIVAESRFGAPGADDAMLILAELEIRTLPLGDIHMREAQEASRRYGKGRHPAALNLADCCANAAAKVERRPLLYKGADFSQNDIPAFHW